MKKTLILIIAMLAIVSVAGLTYAADDAAPADNAAADSGSVDNGGAAADTTTTVDMSLFGLIAKSGNIGLFIILLSFVGLALIIEHAFTIRRDKLLPHYFVVELEELFESEQYEEALQLCETEDNMLSRVIAAGLSKVDMGYDTIEEAMGEAAEETSMTLHHKISYISLISAIAPMLGLLGTVVGMVTSFSVLAIKSSAANAADLAGGISQALMTTVMGLIVAIPLMAAYHFFRNKVMRLDMESGVIAGDLMRRFRPAQNGN